MEKLATGSVILMTGPTGAGKSEQSAILSKKYGWHWIAGGKLLRSFNDPKVKARVSMGELVDNQVINNLVKGELEEIDDNDVIIFDGYPRNIEQIAGFEKNLFAFNRKVAAVILLKVDEATSRKRLLTRHREDDTKEVISTRLEIFSSETLEVIDYYKGKDLVKEINGEETIQNVTVAIEEALGLNGN